MKVSELKPGIVVRGPVPPEPIEVLSKFSTGAGLKLTPCVEVAPPESVSTQRIEETKVALRELGLDDCLDGD